MSLKKKYMPPWPFSTNDLESKLRGTSNNFKETTVKGCLTYIEEGKAASKEGFIERVGRRVNLENFMTCFQSMTVYELVAFRKEENSATSQRISVELCK